MPPLTHFVMETTAYTCQKLVKESIMIPGLTIGATNMSLPRKN